MGRGAAMAGAVLVAQFGEAGHRRSERRKYLTARCGASRVVGDVGRCETQSLRRLLEKLRQVPSPIGHHSGLVEDRLAAGLDEFLRCADRQRRIRFDRGLHTPTLFVQVAQVAGTYSNLLDSDRDAQQGLRREYWSP